MTDSQWDTLVAAVRGAPGPQMPVAFIIDSPWLPNWAGTSITEYLASEHAWFDANRKVVEAFPECIFLPGFWSEFGMCTEPSAFGGKCVFPPNDFPFIQPVTASPEAAAELPEPNPETDGLLPLVLHRLRWAQPRIEQLGHKIRFSVSRGPLNIATFIMGTTEFLVAIKTDPDPMHRFLGTITRFLCRWHQLQRDTFPSIDGIMVLDDVVGFMGEDDFLEFGAPYLEKLFAADAAVKFFHNDAACLSSIRHYTRIGINLYNPGIQQPIAELMRLTSGQLTLLGGIPPREVMAEGRPEDVAATISRLQAEVPDRRRLILSCSGGMAPKVSTENLKAALASNSVSFEPKQAY